MSLEPGSWSVVVVGRWNTAILTPGAIAAKIFKRESLKDVEVRVPIDGRSLYQVKCPGHGVVVVPDDTRLQCHITEQTYDEMDVARCFAINAIEWLPETPFSATGFNVNFQTNNPSPAMLGMLASDLIDKGLIEIGQIQKRSLSRTLQFEDGQLNFGFMGSTELVELHFNFHLAAATKDALINWLKIPLKNVKDSVRRTLANLKLDIEEKTDD